jgi:hypothetical protein
MTGLFFSRPPPPEILEPQNGAVVYTYTPTISGTAAPGSEVEIFIAGKSIGKKKAEEDTGHWEIISTELAEGAYEIQGKSTDEAGNDSPSFASLSFTVKPPRDQAQAIGGGLACASSGSLPQLVVLGGIIGMLLRTRRPRR